MQKKTVIVVGVGISSIMIAYKLFQLGYKVAVYAKGPDPRKNKDVEQYGSTGNGKIGRFVTGFEGETYLSSTLMYPEMQWAFQNPISEGGWLANPVSEFSEKDQEWLRKRYKAANDQDKVKDIFENYYVKNNRWSISEWETIFRLHPALFSGTNKTDSSNGILRLYDTAELFDSAVKVHAEYGFLMEKLTVSEVAARFSTYEEACNRGYVAGALVARGFSLNIHQFVGNVIAYLEQKNVQFHWDTEIVRIEVGSDSIVHGLRTRQGVLLTADHYSVNPGAYGNEILDTTPAAGKLGGVAGRWLIIPQPKDFSLPTKIHGSPREGYPVIDHNLTPFTENSKAMLAVGCGYVYVGSDSRKYDDYREAYCIVDRENERSMEMYLGKFCREARTKDQVKIWHRACVRSFTYDDVPIHEVMRTVNGGYLTITAGTNTGTTTLAPYLAEWTAQVFEQ